MEAIEKGGTAFVNGSVTLMARVVNSLGANILQADIATAKYTVFVESISGVDTAITGHTNVSLVVADVIFDTIQDDAIWTVDTTGYNFRMVLDVRTTPAFTAIGSYRITITLTPVAGQVIILRFLINVK
jgi:hypothetical protein